MEISLAVLMFFRGCMSNLDQGPETIRGFLQHDRYQCGDGFRSTWAVR